jgi:hypothetical protein
MKTEIEIDDKQRTIKPNGGAEPESTRDDDYSELRCRDDDPDYEIGKLDPNFLFHVLEEFTCYSTRRTNLPELDENDRLRAEDKLRWQLPQPVVEAILTLARRAHLSGTYDAGMRSRTKLFQRRNNRGRLK